MLELIFIPHPPRSVRLPSIDKQHGNHVSRSVPGAAKRQAPSTVEYLGWPLSESLERHKSDGAPYPLGFGLVIWPVGRTANACLKILHH